MKQIVYLILLQMLLLEAVANGQTNPPIAKSPTARWRNASPSERIKAIQHAAITFDHQAISWIITLLRDETWTVRQESARALGRLKAREALRSLMVLAQTDEQAEVRQAAAEAVRQIDLQEYVEVLATSDPPPVQPLVTKDSAEKPFPRINLSTALALNSLRATDTFSGQVAVGQQWRHFGLRISLNFPALALIGQAQWSFHPCFWLTPYLGLGAALSFNNGQDRDSSLSLLGGGGLRVKVFEPWLYAYAEVLINFLLYQPQPAWPHGESPSLSLPILTGMGVEL